MSNQKPIKNTNKNSLHITIVPLTVLTIILLFSTIGAYLRVSYAPSGTVRISYDQGRLTCTSDNGACEWGRILKVCFWGFVLSGSSTAVAILIVNFSEPKNSGE